MKVIRPSRPPEPRKLPQPPGTVKTKDNPEVGRSEGRFERNPTLQGPLLGQIALAHRGHHQLTEWASSHFPMILGVVSVFAYLTLAYGAQYGWESLSWLWPWLFFLGWQLFGVLSNPAQRDLLLRWDPEAWGKELKSFAAYSALFGVLLVAGVTAWRIYPRPYNGWSDWLALGLAVASVAWLWKRKLFNWVARGGLGLLAFWVLISVFDFALRGSRSIRPVRSTAASTPRVESPRVGLALSGGGYRAAILHAGVLEALASLGVLPDNLSTVSGGSIIGAYYAAGGKPVDFEEAMIAGKFNLRRELATLPTPVRMMAPVEIPILRFKLLPWFEHDRTEVQEGLIRTLLIGDMTLPDLEQSGGPKLLIGMSDLVSGRAIGGSSEGLLIGPAAQAGETGEAGQLPLRPVEPTRWSGTEALVARLPAARLVAASGAFPGAFANVAIKVSGETGASTLRLADGGLLDNTGIGLLLDADHLARTGSLSEDWKLGLILASDGGQLFRPDADAGILRAVDVIHSVSAIGFAGHRRKSADQPAIIRLAPSSFVELRAEEPALESGSPGLVAVDPALRQGFQLTAEMAVLDPRHLKILASSLLEESRVLLEEKIEESFAARQHLTKEVQLEFDFALTKAVLQDELRRCMATFLSTSTLSDRLGETATREIFRLGQYLVYLRWQDLDEHLSAMRTRAPVEGRVPGRPVE